MTNAAWIIVAYALQIAALVTMASIGTSLLRVRAPRHSLRFWQIVMAIALLLPLAQPRGASVPEWASFPAAFSATPAIDNAVTTQVTNTSQNVADRPPKSAHQRPEDSR